MMNRLAPGFIFETNEPIGRSYAQNTELVQSIRSSFWFRSFPAYFRFEGWKVGQAYKRAISWGCRPAAFTKLIELIHSLDLTMMTRVKFRWNGSRSSAPAFGAAGARSNET